MIGLANLCSESIISSTTHSNSPGSCPESRDPVNWALWRGDEPKGWAGAKRAWGTIISKGPELGPLKEIGVVKLLGACKIFEKKKLTQ